MVYLSYDSDSDSDDGSFYLCKPCGILFSTQWGLNNHLCKYDGNYSSRAHIATVALIQPARCDFHCPMCTSAFASFHAREQHRKAVHPNIRNHSCPFCNKQLTSASSVAQHLESGGCRSGASRQQVDEYVFQASSSGSASAGAIVRRNQARLDPCPVYRATEMAMNGRGYYECYFCPGVEFRLLKQLNQHLESPKHSNRAPGLYTCPTCRVNTQTLSGLIQHAEMGSCGIRQDRGVQSAIEGMTNGMRQIGL